MSLVPSDVSDQPENVPVCLESLLFTEMLGTRSHAAFIPMTWSSYHFISSVMHMLINVSSSPCYSYV